MTGPSRTATMPLAALAVVAGVLAVQLASGGGSYEPLRPADPCAARSVDSQADGIDGLTERLVLLGISGAACRLGVSREALTLDLAQPGSRTDAEIDALREGLLAAVRRMADDGSLPPASGLVDEALDSADLNGFLEAAVRAVPDSVVDAALKTDDVLARAIEDLDLRSLLADLDDQESLNEQVEAAATQAVKDSVVDRLRGLCPDCVRVRTRGPRLCASHRPIGRAQAHDPLHGSRRTGGGRPGAPVVCLTPTHRAGSGTRPVSRRPAELAGSRYARRDFVPQSRRATRPPMARWPDGPMA